MSPWWAVTAAVAGVCLLVLGNPYTAYKERKSRERSLSLHSPERVIAAAFGHALRGSDLQLNAWLLANQQALRHLRMMENKQAVCSYLLTRSEKTDLPLEEKLWCMQALVAVEHDLHDRLYSLIQLRRVR